MYCADFGFAQYFFVAGSERSERKAAVRVPLRTSVRRGAGQPPTVPSFNSDQTEKLISGLAQRASREVFRFRSASAAAAPSAPHSHSACGARSGVHAVTAPLASRAGLPCEKTNKLKSRFSLEKLL